MSAEAAPSYGEERGRVAILEARVLRRAKRDSLFLTLNPHTQPLPGTHGAARGVSRS